MMSWREAVVALVVALMVLTGCATAPGPKEQPTAAVFYPAPPDPPRLQHLVTLTGEADVGSKQTSDFARFIVGDAQAGQHLQQPYGVAIHKGRLYVADTKGPGLMVFDFAKSRFELVHGSGQGRMVHPINVTIDSDGTKYVTDTRRDQILVFDSDDRFIQAFGRPEEFRPVDTAILGQRLYVADIRHHQIHVLDKRTGKRLFKFGKAGSKEGELFHPTNLAVGPEGDIYVVETSNFRVQRFTAEGKPVRTYGRVGTAPGQFTRPKGIAIDREGRLYVGDSAFENVQILDKGGRLLLDFGKPREGRQGLNLPAGVVIDYDNVEYFKRYAEPNFTLEYVVFVVSQFGPNKVDVYGFGKMAGMTYGSDETRLAERSKKPR